MNGPYLANPHEGYLQAKTKVVFVGQETCGWPSRDIDAQMEKYRCFGLGKTYRYRGSAFWKAVRTLEFALTDSNFNSVVLNLNRFDQGKRTPSEKNRTSLSKLDGLLKSELALLAPHVVIYFTGPLHGYDGRLEEAFKTTQGPIDGFKPRQLCRLISDSLPPATFRTYHPSFLQRRRKQTSLRRYGEGASVLETIAAEARSLLL
jgi:hypothetical protein